MEPMKMEPIKTLIVDDEIFVAASLKSLIDWKELGYEISGVCYSGRDALGFIERNPIDLMICDIKMPEMTGLELISKVRQEKPYIQSIIISGYADFSYARDAIKNGVTAYCLKPFCEDEIISVLETIKEKVMEERSKDEHIIADLLFTSADSPVDTVEKNLRKLGFDTQNPMYICAMLGAKCNFDLIAKYRYASVGYKTYVYIVEPFDSIDTIIGVMREICQKSGANGGIAPIKNLAYFTQTISNALLSARHYFISEKNDVSIFARNKNDKIQELTSIIENISLKSPREETINNICNIFKSSPYTVRDAYIFFNMLVSHFLGISQLAIFNCDNYDAMIDEFGTFREMITRIITPSAESEITQDDKPSLILKARKYYAENYTEPISITKASEMLHINPSYFSALFKKETGENFTTYITRLRLEKAKELLSNTNENVSDIAIQVGYSEYYYFAKVFKKFTGLTPTNYRQLTQNAKSR